MVIARTRDGGLELLEFHPGVDVCPDDAPLTFVLVAAEYQGQTLLLYTLERNQWELPGGAIEAGESPQDCAVRELFEETGQVATSFEYKGLFKIYLTYSQKLEYGMLYTAGLDSLQPFTVNTEAERILLWDRITPLDDHLGELNTALLKFCDQP